MGRRPTTTSSHTLFLQPSHCATGRIEPPGAATGQHNRMDLLHQIGGGEQIGLAGARRRPPHIHASHGALPGHDHGAAGGTPGVGVVADLDAGHIGDAARSLAAAPGLGGRV